MGAVMEATIVATMGAAMAIVAAMGAASIMVMPTVVPTGMLRAAMDAGKSVEPQAEVQGAVAFEPLRAAIGHARTGVCGPTQLRTLATASCTASRAV
jgi:hypothetical protein